MSTVVSTVLVVCSGVGGQLARSGSRALDRRLGPSWVGSTSRVSSQWSNGVRHDSCMNELRPVPMHEILRYVQGASRMEIELDWYLNDHSSRHLPT
jgi:hypothetical protein